jgi:DNA-binding MarR family transcriptional regulator
MSQELISPAGRNASADTPTLALQLTQVSEALRRGLKPFLNEADLHAEQWRILTVLADRPGLRMSDIGDAAVIAPASLTRHMDNLVERALVIRRIDPEDKRRAVCALSAVGHGLTERIRAEEAALEHRLAEGLGLERYQHLLHELGLAAHLLD